MTVKRPVGTESNDEFGVVCFTPRMNRRFAVVAVGTKKQDRIGKTVADLPDNSFEQRQNLPPVGVLPDRIVVVMSLPVSPS